MNQKTTIQIFCAINPSEDPDKIKTAVNNIFPEIELDVSETEISGKTNNFSTYLIYPNQYMKKTSKVPTNEFSNETTMVTLLGFISISRLHL